MNNETINYTYNNGGYLFRLYIKMVVNHGYLQRFNRKVIQFHMSYLLYFKISASFFKCCRLICSLNYHSFTLPKEDPQST